MSERTAKQEAQAAKKAQRIDLQNQLANMRREQATKIEASKKHLLDQIETASQKYLTVNGYMDARYLLEQAYLGDYAKDAPEALRDNARDLAEKASKFVGEIHALVEKADLSDYPNLLDDLFDHKFIYSSFGECEVAEQLMRISVLQNIGPSLDDAWSFWSKTEEDIELVNQKLKDL